MRRSARPVRTVPRVRTRPARRRRGARRTSTGGGRPSGARLRRAPRCPVPARRRPGGWTPPWCRGPGRTRPAANGRAPAPPDDAPPVSSPEVLAQRGVEVADPALLVPRERHRLGAGFEAALDAAQGRRVLVEDAPEVPELRSVGPPFVGTEVPGGCGRRAGVTNRVGLE